MGSSERGEGEKLSELKFVEFLVLFGIFLSDCLLVGDYIDRVCNLVGKFRFIETKGKFFLNVKCDLFVKSDLFLNIDLEVEVVECKSDVIKEKEIMCIVQIEEEENSNSEFEFLFFDNIQLRFLKENLRKINIYFFNRFLFIEFRRFNISFGCVLETVREKFIFRL